MLEKYRHYISSINSPSHPASHEVQPAQGRQIAQRAAVQPTLQDINQKKNPQKLVGNNISSSPVESTHAVKSPRRQVVNPTPGIVNVCFDSLSPSNHFTLPLVKIKMSKLVGRLQTSQYGVVDLQYLLRTFQHIK